jgi:hypothetical protein
MMAAEKLSLEAIGRFVEASEEIQFEAENRQQLYAWVGTGAGRAGVRPVGQGGAGPAATI